MLKTLWDLAVAQSYDHYSNNRWESPLIMSFVIRMPDVRDCCILNGVNIPLGSPKYPKQLRKECSLEIIALPFEKTEGHDILLDLQGQCCVSEKPSVLLLYSYKSSMVEMGIRWDNDALYLLGPALLFQGQ